jgi:hypothetical protein
VREDEEVVPVTVPTWVLLPGSRSGDRARADLHRALAAGEPVDDEIVDRLVLPLVDQAVPEWQSTEKTLHAGTGGHTGVPPFAGDDAARFFVRHLQ